MTGDRLPLSYLTRAETRLSILDIFMGKKDYPDIIREAQEIVELCQKAILVKKGVNPPKWHDVSDVIEGYLTLMPEIFRETLKDLTKGAKWLRSQREVSFYGSMDLIPEDLYTHKDAQRALEIASRYVEVTRGIVKE